MDNPVDTLADNPVDILVDNPADIVGRTDWADILVLVGDVHAVHRDWDFVHAGRCYTDWADTADSHTDFAHMLAADRDFAHTLAADILVVDMAWELDPKAGQMGCAVPMLAQFGSMVDHFEADFGDSRKDHHMDFWDLDCS